MKANNEGYNREHYEALWLEYMTGNDPHHAASAVFGNPKWH